jgi:hypothetical protein
MNNTSQLSRKLFLLNEGTNYVADTYIAKKVTKKLVTFENYFGTKITLPNDENLFSSIEKLFVAK